MNPRRKFHSSCTRRNSGHVSRRIRQERSCPINTTIASLGDSIDTSASGELQLGGATLTIVEEDDSTYSGQITGGC